MDRQPQARCEAPLPIVILISGNGSNLQAIIDAREQGLPVEILAVISNRRDAHGLTRARQAGLTTALIEHDNYPDREAFDRALQGLIDHYRPELVVLAGFMRILGNGFVRRYLGRMINIHPSLLPAFTGLHTHRRALAAQAEEHGASVHFVTEQLDGGPVIIQARVPVLADDTELTLQQRVLEQEHRILPLAIRWFAQGRLRLQDNQVMLNGCPLTTPYQYRN
ncbi:MAG: phosphoribosylglycinamide formyltransferase [Gammaproteobacteria bacterium RBG_16_57_12]|nr:MAG: phosphoribosylglycinamide formyltransferase [Gammaproteobacteria bacterium RBG_16_57_12]